MKILDAIDHQILHLLQDNAKYTNKEIASRLGMTTTPIYERIKRLEEDGYIRKYVALVDREKLDFAMVSYCKVSLKEHTQNYHTQFEKQVLGLKEVQECYHIAGSYDYLLRVIAQDMPSYQDFIVNKLAALDNIGKVESSFVMTEVKYTTALNDQVHVGSNGRKK